ncbi:MAG: hypothetical protein IH947_08745 [Bacteroidetes bacterium]|nr:hypothetical protein [Bacteroidota bacterium]
MSLAVIYNVSIELVMLVRFDVATLAYRLGRCVHISVVLDELWPSNTWIYLRLVFRSNKC